MSLPLFYPPAPESHRWVSRMRLFFFFFLAKQKQAGLFLQDLLGLLCGPHTDMTVLDSLIFLLEQFTWCGSLPQNL